MKILKNIINRFEKSFIKNERWVKKTIEPEGEPSGTEEAPDIKKELVEALKKKIVKNEINENINLEQAIKDIIPSILNDGTKSLLYSDLLKRVGLDSISLNLVNKELKDSKVTLLLDPNTEELFFINVLNPTEKTYKPIGAIAEEIKAKKAIERQQQQKSTGGKKEVTFQLTSTATKTLRQRIEDELQNNPNSPKSAALQAKLKKLKKFKTDEQGLQKEKAERENKWLEEAKDLKFIDLPEYEEVRFSDDDLNHINSYEDWRGSIGKIRNYRALKQAFERLGMGLLDFHNAFYYRGAGANYTNFDCIVENMPKYKKLGWDGDDFIKRFNHTDPETKTIMQKEAADIKRLMDVIRSNDFSIDKKDIKEAKSVEDTMEGYVEENYDKVKKLPEFKGETIDKEIEMTTDMMEYSTNFMEYYGLDLTMSKAVGDKLTNIQVDKDSRNKFLATITLIVLNAYGFDALKNNCLGRRINIVDNDTLVLKELPDDFNTNPNVQEAIKRALGIYKGDKSADLYYDFKVEDAAFQNRSEKDQKERRSKMLFPQEFPGMEVDKGWWWKFFNFEHNELLRSDILNQETATKVTEGSISDPQARLILKHEIQKEGGDEIKVLNNYLKKGKTIIKLIKDPKEAEQYEFTPKINNENLKNLTKYQIQLIRMGLYYNFISEKAKILAQAKEQTPKTPLSKQLADLLMEKGYLAYPDINNPDKPITSEVIANRYNDIIKKLDEIFTHGFAVGVGVGGAKGFAVGYGAAIKLNNWLSISFGAASSTEGAGVGIGAQFRVTDRFSIKVNAGAGSREGAFGGSIGVAYDIKLDDPIRIAQVGAGVFAGLAGVGAYVEFNEETPDSSNVQVHDHLDKTFKNTGWQGLKEYFSANKNLNDETKGKKILDWANEAKSSKDKKYSQQEISLANKLIEAVSKMPAGTKDTEKYLILSDVYKMMCQISVTAAVEGIDSITVESAGFYAGGGLLFGVIPFAYAGPSITIGWGHEKITFYSIDSSVQKVYDQIKLSNLEGKIKKQFYGREAEITKQIINGAEEQLQKNGEGKLRRIGSSTLTLERNLEGSKTADITRRAGGKAEEIEVRDSDFNKDLKNAGIELTEDPAKKLHKINIENIEDANTRVFVDPTSEDIEVIRGEDGGLYIDLNKNPDLIIARKEHFYFAKDDEGKMKEVKIFITSNPRTITEIEEASDIAFHHQGDSKWDIINTEGYGDRVALNKDYQTTQTFYEERNYISNDPNSEYQKGLKERGNITLENEKNAKIKELEKANNAWQKGLLDTQLIYNERNGIVEDSRREKIQSVLSEWFSNNNNEKLYRDKTLIGKEDWQTIYTSINAFFGTKSVQPLSSSAEGNLARFYLLNESFRKIYESIKNIPINQIPKKELNRILEVRKKLFMEEMGKMRTQYIAKNPGANETELTKVINNIWENSWGNIENSSQTLEQLTTWSGEEGFQFSGIAGVGGFKGLRAEINLSSEDAVILNAKEYKINSKNNEEALTAKFLLFINGYNELPAKENLNFDNANEITNEKISAIENFLSSNMALRFRADLRLFLNESESNNIKILLKNLRSNSSDQLKQQSISNAQEALKKYEDLVYFTYQFETGQSPNPSEYSSLTFETSLAPDEQPEEGIKRFKVTNSEGIEIFVDVQNPTIVSGLYKPCLNPAFATKENISFAAKKYFIPRRRQVISGEESEVDLVEQKAGYKVQTITGALLIAGAGQAKEITKEEVSKDETQAPSESKPAIKPNVPEKSEPSAKVPNAVRGRQRQGGSDISYGPNDL